MNYSDAVIHVQITHIV